MNDIPSSFQEYFTFFFVYKAKFKPTWILRNIAEFSVNNELSVNQIIHALNN